jgi:hypothetical protein
MRLCLALAGVLVLAPIALAHDSWISDRGLTDPVSGQWCCNQHDCAPEQVREVGGGYLVQTGEVIPFRRVIWKSQDGRWWRCRRYQDGNESTRCLIGPPPGS